MESHNDIESDYQAVADNRETSFADESSKVKAAEDESSNKSQVDNEVRDENENTQPVKIKKRKKRKRNNEKKEEKNSYKIGSHSAVTDVNGDNRESGHNDRSLLALEKDELVGTKSSIEIGKEKLEKGYRYNSVQDTKQNSGVKNNESALASVDIFCVEKDLNRNDQSETNAFTSSALKKYPENVKQRKKKKRLPDIKKRSSKVAIKTDLVLPPITSTSLPVTSPRSQGTEKDETSVNLSEISEKPTNKNDGEKRDHKEPIWICKLFYRFPVTFFVIVSLCHLAVIALTVGLFATGYDIFPIVFDELPLYIHNDVRLKELSWRERTQVDGFVYRPVYGLNIATGTRSEIKDTVEVIFEKKGGNILSRHDLTMLKNSEDRLFYNHRFQSYFCLLTYGGSCVNAQSILRLFDGTYAHVDPVFDDRNFNNISTVIYKASLYNETRDFLYLFLGKGSQIHPDYVSTSITRTFFFMGWPLGRMEDYRYGSFNDLQTFLVHEFKSEIEDLRDNYFEGVMELYYLSKVMLEYDLVQQALKDILLAIGSISFIFVFMCFQTGSFTITFLGILSIVSSFLWTNIIYRYVFQYIYFGFFHVIALFLILGIGADDLFVFYDTWRLTGHNEYPTDAHRLSDCYRRAAKTTFVTSCTTMVAFLVSGLSPLLPVRTFGIFAGVLVGINYLWVIVYFPVIILFHHLKFKGMWHKFHSILLSIWFEKTSPSETTHNASLMSDSTSSAALSETNSAKILIDDEHRPHADSQMPKLIDKFGEDTDEPTLKNFAEKQADSRSEWKKDKSVSENVKISIPGNTIKDNKEKQTDVTVNGLDLNEIKESTIRDEIIERKQNKPKKNFEDRNRVVNFLKNGFFDFMTLRAVKFAIPVLFVGVSIFFIYSATKIEPDTHQLRLFRSTHNYAKASKRHYFYFIRNHEDEYQRLYLVWGLEPADISYCNLKSGKFCHGKTILDYGFNMESDAAQVAMKDFCESLKHFDPALADRLRIRRDTSTNQFQIACFTDDFDAYFERESQERSIWTGIRKYPEHMNLSLPVTPGNVSDFMAYNSQIYPYTLPSNFDRYFQILVSFWMTDGYSIQATSDYFKYNNLFGEHRVDGTQSAFYTYSGLFYGTRTMYLAVEINTTMNVYSLNYKDGMPIFEEWEAFMNSINSGMPGPLKKGFQVTENLWHWIHVQETLANSAVIGILIGLFSAWPILVFTTLNFIIGTIAVVTIGLVTACVVGMIPLAGWRLGVLESINLCMVVGLSVDYIVHLAEAYRMSESTRRLDRVRSMLESIGLSVISGAITTIGAAVFMLFAQIQFFFQFGLFIISTVGISLLFSLFCFTTFMSLIGPQGTSGSINVSCSSKSKTCHSSKTDKTGGDTDSKNSKHSQSCRCLSLYVLKERLFDWISYRNDNKNIVK